MCLGSMDLSKVRKVKALLNKAIDDLILNHRDVLCKNPSKDFIRNRDFTPKKIISTLLRYGSSNAESELIDILECKDTARNINAAFLQQRKKLGKDCFPWLFRKYTEAIFDSPSFGFDKYLVKGRYILGCDGSDVNIAYNPNDAETFITKKGKKGYNQVHLNALYEVCTGAWMSASIQGIHKKHERKALVDMIGQLKYAKQSIITADRGYESFNVFAACIEAGASFVIRLKDIESNGIISAYDLPDDEFDTYIETKLTKRRTKETISHPEIYTILPQYTDFDFFDNEQTYDITVRIVRFRLPNGNYICLATNLSEEEFTIADLAELYRLRWGCEVGFRKLKYTIGLVNFHSWKREYIMQELYARLILFNFCAFTVKAIDTPDLTHPVDAPENKSAEKSAKKKGIAFSQAVTVCRKLLVKKSLAFIKDAIKTIKAHTFSIKKDRTFKRSVKPQSSKPFVHKPS